MNRLLGSNGMASPLGINLTITRFQARGVLSDLEIADLSPSDRYPMASLWTMTDDT
jgi:hypothetical protein